MIPVYKPYVAKNQRKYVMDCVDTNWISSRGSYIDKFERALESYLQVPHAITTFNGSVSLSLIMRCLRSQFEEEQEVLVGVPTLTYAATVSAIQNEKRMTPVFLDVDGDLQLNITEEDMAKIHVLIVPQLYGNCPDMARIKDLCEKYLVHLVEDSAEVFGSRFNGQQLGTIGIAGSYSFFGNKVITTGEGGAIVTSNSYLAKIARHLKNQAHFGNFMHDGPGFNYRMTNIQAAIGLAQLEEIETIIHKKKVVAEVYRDKIKKLDIETPVLKCDSSEWMPLFFLPEGLSANDLEIFMREQGVETRPVFKPMRHLMERVNINPIRWWGHNVYRDIGDKYLRGFNLPSYPDLKHEELVYIVDCLERFLLK